MRIFSSEHWHHRSLLCALGIVFLGGVTSGVEPARAATPSGAGTTDISTTPPDKTVAVQPNVALTFDDSGSMSFGYLPDDIGSTFGGSCNGMSSSNKARYEWSGYNRIYYDPQVSYTPPKKADGTSFGNVAFNNAPLDGYASVLGYGSQGVDLRSGYVPTLEWDRADVDRGGNTTLGNGCRYDTSGAAYYTSKSGNSFTKVKLTNSNIGATVDGAKRTDAEEKQNFANWFSYYRTRNLMAKTSLSRAFESVDGSIRLIWQTIWPHTTDECIQYDRFNRCVEELDRTWSTAIGDSTTIDAFTGTVRSSFYDWLQKLESANSTPDRAATVRVGEYFKRDMGSSSVSSGVKYSTSNPYWNGKPSGDGGGNITCRKNFHIMVTDGYWNESDDDVSSPGFTAEANRTLPETPNYSLSDSLSKIFWNVNNGTDGTNNKSMANIAFYYWASDLQPDIDNNVQPNWVEAVVSGGDGEVSRTDSVNFYNPKNDPATWQHLSQYVVTLGMAGILDYPGDYDDLISGAKKWPRPDVAKYDRRGQLTNPDAVTAAADDMWHAAVNSRGNYFSASDPSELTAALNSIISSALGGATSAVAGTVNTAVLTAGAISYGTQYDPADWSGDVLAQSLSATTGDVGTDYWSAADKLDALSSPSTSRVILTSKFDNGEVSGVDFQWNNLSDDQRTMLNIVPGSSSGAHDDLGDERLSWLRGDKTEDGGKFRSRTSLLGAVVNSQAVYVSYPAAGYRNSFPQIGSGPASPEMEAIADDSADCADDSTCHTYDQFVQNHINRSPVIYVGANDGMLHAFNASVDADTGLPTGAAGSELWAYVPYSVYPNLSKLTLKTGYKDNYMPTVDGTPVVRDVFFSDNGADEWHSILVAGLRYGGRGVYALDVTDSTATAAGASTKVLWEFNASSTGADAGDLTQPDNPANLGYTFGQPNIGRLANGKWVVLVPSGYFPDCNALSRPTPCDRPAAAANTTSSLFVLNAQTGELIRELKTPSNVTSFGLTSPVLGDYNDDQIDDIAVAGDLVGNLWRYDLSDPEPDNWSVTRLFAPATAKAQPITVMPRLFADPATGRFIVVFGTGKFLATEDNVTDNAVTQAIYGIRDATTAHTIDELTQQKMSDITGTGDNQGDIIRGLTNNAVASDSGGWYINLDVEDGERVVVTPSALFDTGRLVLTTLIPGGNDPCSPGHNGAIMVIDAATGGAGSGLSSLGPTTWTSGGDSFAAAGARVSNVGTGGTLPVLSRVGGGSLIVPGVKLNGGSVLNINDAVWRRRSWREIPNN